MTSRTIIYYLYVGFFLLAINIWAYYGSQTYRQFIDTLKYGDTLNINDDISLESIPGTSSGTRLSNTNSGTTFSARLSSVSLSGGVSGTGSKTLTGIILSPEEEKVLTLFNEYDLKKLLVHPSLFDLTTEYPDEYSEYYSENLTLYIFSTKNYREVVNIFEAFAVELPFILNKTNSFGTNSFFINVKPEFQDDFTRFVFEYQQKVFGLKIKKDQYNSIRMLIKNLP